MLSTKVSKTPSSVRKMRAKLRRHRSASLARRGQRRTHEKPLTNAKATTIGSVNINCVQSSISLSLGQSQSQPPHLHRVLEDVRRFGSDCRLGHVAEWLWVTSSDRRSLDDSFGKRPVAQQVRRVGGQRELGGVGRPEQLSPSEGRWTAVADSLGHETQTNDEDGSQNDVEQPHPAQAHILVLDEQLADGSPESGGSDLLSACTGVRPRWGEGLVLRFDLRGPEVGAADEKSHGLTRPRFIAEEVTRRGSRVTEGDLRERGRLRQESKYGITADSPTPSCRKAP